MQIYRIKKDFIEEHEKYADVIAVESTPLIERNHEYKYDVYVREINKSQFKLWGNNELTEQGLETYKIEQ